MKKFLIKENLNQIHTLSKNDGSLLYLNLQEPISQMQFQQYGMSSLVEYENEINKVVYEMNEDRVLEGDYIIRQKINKNKFKINSIEVR